MSLRIFGYAWLGVICSTILGLAGTFAYFCADRRMPVEVLSTEVLAPVVRPGGQITIR